MHLEDQAIFPGPELFLIKQFMASKGIPLETWLMGTGLSSQQLEPQYLKGQKLLVSLHQFDVIYRNIFRLLPEQALALELGEALNLSRWGVLASALMNCKTLGHALLTANQYRTLLRSRYVLSGQLNESDGNYEVTLKQQAETQLPLPQHFHIELLLTSLNTQISELIARPYQFREVRLEYDKPEHFKAYEEYLQCPITFNNPCNQILIEQDVMLAPLPLANPIAKRQALATCEMEIQRVLQTQQKDVPWQVRSLIAQGGNGHIKLDAIADSMAMSPRSLRRKLLDAKTSFLVLRQEFQLQQAMNLLAKKQLQVGQVAGLCGYKDLGSFRDGFKKLSGQTPQQYRSGIH